MNEIVCMKQSRIKGDEMLIMLKSFDDYCRLMMLCGVFIALTYSLMKMSRTFFKLLRVISNNLNLKIFGKILNLIWEIILKIFIKKLTYNNSNWHKINKKFLSNFLKYSIKIAHNFFWEIQFLTQRVVYTLN